MSASKTSLADSTDQLLDELEALVEAAEIRKRKAAEARRRSKESSGSGSRDDFFRSMTDMVENNANSDMSDADVRTMARSIAGLDDMDADLFGDSLKKKSHTPAKGSGQGSKLTTPRKNGGGTSTPRSNNIATTSRGGEWGASPTRCDTPTSPPSSARSGSLKRKPMKPSSSFVSAAISSSVSMCPPGTAPGKMTDLGRASENLKPGQTNTEDLRPGTVPRVKKYYFGEFHEDDPLAGLSLDEESDWSDDPPSPKRGPSSNQKSPDDVPFPPWTGSFFEPDSTDQFLDELEAFVEAGSARKSHTNLFDRPPTRSGSGTRGSQLPAEAVLPVKTAEPVRKRKEEMVFSDDDNFLDDLGIDDSSKKTPASTAGATTSAAGATAPKTGSLLDNTDKSRPAKSVMDDLLGRGQKSAASLLEPKEKPRTFVLDKKYTQQHEEGRSL